jgi:hypothetical protein
MNKFEAPTTDWKAQTSELSKIWQAAAEEAANIASSKRKIFLAYVSEGFTEPQALELIKSL